MTFAVLRARPRCPAISWQPMIQFSISETSWFLFTLTDCFCLLVTDENHRRARFSDRTFLGRAEEWTCPPAGSLTFRVPWHRSASSLFVSVPHSVWFYVSPHKHGTTEIYRSVLGCGQKRVT